MARDWAEVKEGTIVGSGRSQQCMAEDLAAAAMRGQIMVPVVLVSLEEWTHLQARLDKQRQGGLKGGPARALALGPAERMKIARKAARERWKKKKG